MLFFGRPWQSPLNTREPSVLSRGKRLFIVAALGSDPQPRFIHDVVDLEKLLYLLDLASRRRRGDDAALFQYRKGASSLRRDEGAPRRVHAENDGNWVWANLAVVVVGRVRAVAGVTDLR